MAESEGGYLVSGKDGDHLPTSKNGKRDHGLMGAAWAALHGGYRGNKYEGPGKAEAIAKLKAMYKAEGMETPGEAKQATGSRNSEVGEDEFRIQAACRVLQSADAEGKAWDVEITTQGPSKSGRLDWPREVLQRDAGQFNKVPSYRNHAYEHSVDDLIGHIDNPRMGDGALIGTLQVLDPAVWGPKLRAIQAMPEGIAGMSLDCYVQCEPPPKGENGDPAWYTRGKQAQGQAKPLKVKRVVKVNSVDLVSPPDAGGRILRAVASQNGPIEWVEFSPAAEREPTAGTKLGGTTVKEKIQRVLQAIKRFDPAKAAALETEIASFDEEKQFDRVTQAMLELPVETEEEKEKREEAARVQQQGAGQASGLTDADRAALKDAAANVAAARVMQCQATLAKELIDSKLPIPLRQEIERRFTGREFKAEELAEEIKQVRQTYAKVVPEGRATGTVVSMGLCGADKLQVALDKAFGLSHEVEVEDGERGIQRVKQGGPLPGHDIPAFRGIREAYVAYTGDAEITGTPDARRITQIESTASFPLALANTLNRLLVREYGAVEYSEAKIISQVTAPQDFRTQERVRVGYIQDLANVTEDAPYVEVSDITDEQATYNIVTFGGLRTVTRRAIINDDIGLIKRNVGLLGRAARRTLARNVWNHLINNDTYTVDSTAVFIAGHSNLGALPLDSLADGVTAMDAIKAAMWLQAEKDSGERLALIPKFIAVPIQLHSVALELNNSQLIGPAAGPWTHNPYFQYFGASAAEPEGIIKQPLMTDVNDWLAFADPNIIDTIEIGYLQGRQMPEFFLADNPLVGSMFTQDRIVYKIRHEYQSCVLDYRGMYKQVVP